MSISNLTLELLGIPDHNIIVNDIVKERRGAKHQKVKVVDATLTYQLSRCPHCGYSALRPNGTYKSHVHVSNNDDLSVVIDLHR